MKTLIALAVLGGMVVLFPYFGQSKVTAKKVSPGYVRREATKSARIANALDALKRNDRSQTVKVRSAIAELEPGDHRRPQIAALLAERGEVEAAYDLEHERVHFMESSVPDDKEMALYAALSEKTGHVEEAAWARDRMGEDGHFRVWKRGAEDKLAQDRTHWDATRLYYPGFVEREMADGMRLYPKFRTEIEELRRESLAPSKEMKP